jgi:signal transduction histidine kinase
MKKVFFIFSLVYFLTVMVLLTAVYQFLKNWQMSELNFFVAGILVLTVALVWGYILMLLTAKPKQEMEERLRHLSKEIIHELNIPLATIYANTLLLEKNLTDTKSLKRLRRVNDASKRLEKLYNQLVYTLNKEIHTVEKEIFNIKTLIEERVEYFEAQRRNPFLVKVADYSIFADKIGFEQMFDNLLSNAMKYSPKDTLISISLEEDILSIKDKGIGMTSAELLRIYERYFQANKAQKGEGIGLALVQEYCHQENIHISIQSQKNLGTTISLLLVK